MFLTRQHAFLKPPQGGQLVLLVNFVHEAKYTLYHYKSTNRIWFTIRISFLMFHASLALTGYILLIGTHFPTAQYVGTFLATSGVYVYDFDVKLVAANVASDTR